MIISALAGICKRIFRGVRRLFRRPGHVTAGVLPLGEESGVETEDVDGYVAIDSDVWQDEDIDPTVVAEIDRLYEDCVSEEPGGESPAPAQETTTEANHMEEKPDKRVVPEEYELQKKRAELAKLDSELAERELELATLRVDLSAFENHYLAIVGRRYAELDEIEAQIAEAFARQSPGDEASRERAEAAREHARESARAAESADESVAPRKFKPSENLKRLYRQVAKAVHPDLATNEKERARRKNLMAEANKAYAEGDEERLRAILQEWESSPESVRGEGPGAELVRVIRKIAQVGRRLECIEAEIKELLEGDVAKLKEEVEEAERSGRDILAEMAEQVDHEIAETRTRLMSIMGRG